MKIIVAGDIHGQFNRLNRFLNVKHPDILLQTGDFGYWPKFFNTTYLDFSGHSTKYKAEIKTHNTKIYWCDGNHEDHESLLKRETDELWPNVFYMSRGKTMKLPDGRNVLFIGGAYSIDKEWRTAGHDWFPEETISQRDIMNLPDERVDIVISHTAPKEFEFKDPRIEFRRFPDPSREALSVVLNKYKPDRWLFGHFHIYQNGAHYNNTYWTALCDIAGGHPWWIDI